MNWNKNRRPLTKFLILVLVFTLVVSGAVVGVSAADNTAKAVFKASEADANGYFTLDLTLSNAEFNAFQFCVKFNPAVVNAAEKNGGPVTETFGACATRASGADWMATIGTSISNTKGLLDFCGYLSPGSLNALISNGNVVVGDAGVALFSFQFKVIGEGDPGFSIATSKDAVYNPSLPTGGLVSKAGESADISATFDIPASLGKATTVVIDNAVVPPSSASTGTGTTPATGGVDTNIVTDEMKAARNKDTLGLQIGNYAAVKGGVLTWVDLDNKNVMPYIKNSRTMVPLRFISEQLEAVVEWDNANRTAIVTKGANTITVPIGADSYTLNGKEYPQDAPAEIVESRTFVPIRFIAEALSLDVEWEATNRVVIIAPLSAPWDLTSATEKAVLSDWLLVMSPLVRDFV